jgi:hypothetical protein
MANSIPLLVDGAILKASCQHMMSQDILSLLSVLSRVNSHGHALLTYRVHNKDAWVVKPPSPPFLLFIPTVLIFFWGKPGWPFAKMANAPTPPANGFIYPAVLGYQRTWSPGCSDPIYVGCCNCIPATSVISPYWLLFICWAVVFSPPASFSSFISGGQTFWK